MDYNKNRHKLLQCEYCTLMLKVLILLDGYCLFCSLNKLVGRNLMDPFITCILPRSGWWIIIHLILENNCQSCWKLSMAIPLSSLKFTCLNSCSKAIILLDVLAVHLFDVVIDSFRIASIKSAVFRINMVLVKCCLSE